MLLHYLLVLHVLVFLPHFLLSSANPSPAPDPYPAVISLPTRQPPLGKPLAAATPPPPEVEHDLLPFVLISTIDGALHAVDREGGKVRWTLRDGVEPLVGGGVRGKGNEEEYIVEPLSGSLYVFDEEELGGRGEAPKIRKLPLSVEQLIELSPFTFPHSPSRIFTGSKHTSLLTLDLRTGQQLNCFSSLNRNSSNAEDDCVCENENEQLLDDLEGKGRANRDMLFVGRTDYRLTIHSPPSSSPAFSPSTLITSGRFGVGEKRGVGGQEIVYSTYTPNSYNRPLADYWAKVGVAEQMWKNDGTVAKRTRVELGHDGVAVGVEQGGGVRWITKLGSVGIAVYDILLPLSPPSANPILVPQPPPHLPSLFPLPAQPHPSHLDVLSKPPTTYIGAVPRPPTLLPSVVTNGTEDTPSPPASSKDDYPHPTATASDSKALLYALSSTAYPLVHFAPPPRPGSLTNGSFVLSEDLPERDQLLPYLLDPPAEDMAAASLLDAAVVDSSRLREKPDAGKGWVWWVCGVLGTLLLCGFAALGLSKHPGEKLATTPPTDEKTPLLAERKPKSESERVVTFVEPTLSPTTASAVTVAEGEDLATPGKKKSARRRVRGRKKKKDDSASVGGEGEGEEEEVEDDKGEGSSSGTPPKGKGEKPLPDLPREISGTDIHDQSDKERLAISDTIIGYGSHGTVVLKGTWGGRPVAVKRLLSDFTRLASQEVKLLQASDDHPNVIRYYCQERRDNFLYIALDLCQASLADLLETPDKYLELASVLDRKKALAQVTLGLKHLHGMKIIHRDIKPQNVLVSQLKDGSLRMLVSDFGLARRLEQDQSSFAPTANNLAGSLGWRAPECIRGQVRLNEGFDRASSCSSSSTGSSSSLLDLLEGDDKESGTGSGTNGANGRGRHYARLTKAVDLFALGCLYFWVLLSGEHPFGETYNRESNIVKGEAVNLAQLDILGEEGWEAKALIERLLAMDPANRPDTSECLTHPFFWTPTKRLAFLCDASDRFEIMETDPPEPTLVLLETDAVSVVGRDWFSRADKVFTSNLGKYRKYRGNSVRDLLRAMRNKKHHYQDLEPAAKRHLGALPAGFLHYFTSRYPTLFLHVHRVIRDSRLQREPMFDQYFQEGG